MGASTPAGVLADGTYTPTIKVFDAAGNSTASTGTAFTVDASVPVLAGDLAAASDSSGTLAGVAAGSSSDRITSDVTPAFIAAARTAGLTTGVWAANHRAEIEKALDLGMDAFATDDPPLAIELRKARG